MALETLFFGWNKVVLSPPRHTRYLLSAAKERSMAMEALQAMTSKEAVTLKLENKNLGWAQGKTSHHEIH